MWSHIYIGLGLPWAALVVNEKALRCFSPAPLKIQILACLRKTRDNLRGTPASTIFWFRLSYQKKKKNIGLDYIVKPKR